MRQRQTIPLLAGLVFTACSSVPTRTLRIDAIGVDEKPVPCIVVVGDDWAGAAEKNQFVNLTGDDTLALQVAFEQPSVDIIVAAVPVDQATGKPLMLPKSRDESAKATSFLADFAQVRLTDPDRQLFILRQR
ncbi:MAG: hypothetical protein FJ265_03060 [Planctomycetes bacterium]|nr:hypothetical protein [Planctomycetota bacterium]